MEGQGQGLRTALTMAIRMTAPMTATNMLYRLNPVTPERPRVSNRKPPMTAPTMPTIGVDERSLLTIRLHDQAVDPAHEGAEEGPQEEVHGRPFRSHRCVVRPLRCDAR